MAIDSFGGRRGVPSTQVFIQRSWDLLTRFPARLREWDFWIIQVSVALMTGLHYGAELALPQAPFWSLHHIPVILYIIPIAYASIRYRWEGGLLTSGWITLLVLPSILLWHTEDYMWLGELLRLIIVVAVGVTLASRVEAEARQRRQAEAVSAKLAVSEAKFRVLFEAAGDAILVFDRTGSILTANAAAAFFFGTPGSHLLLGQHIGAFMPAWEDHLLSLPDDATGGVKGPARITIRRSDGSDLLAEVVVAAVPNSGGEDAFQAVFRDATAQEMREKGLRSLVHQISQAQEAERQRIARELHDDSLQSLVLLSRELESMADGPEVPRSMHDRLRRMAGLAIHTAEDLRRFCRNLRPSILDDLGLVPAIEWLVEDLSRRTGLQAHFHLDGDVLRLPAHVELALFRIAQEALHNVEKHAYATTAQVMLSFEPFQVSLKVADDGVGFTPPSNVEELVLKGKSGLAGLKERVSLVGGTQEVHSTPGQGTRVSVVIPLTPMPVS